LPHPGARFSGKRLNKSDIASTFFLNRITLFVVYGQEKLLDSSLLLGCYNDRSVNAYKKAKMRRHYLVSVPTSMIL